MDHISNKLTLQITLGLFLGALFGYLVQSGLIPEDEILTQWISLGGDIFVQVLKIIAIPLVFISIVVGISNLGSIKLLGRVGSKTLLLFISTTFIAVGSSLLFTSLLNPRFELNLASNNENSDFTVPFITDTIYNVISTNPLEAMMNGNMLQVILLALLLGIIFMLITNKNSRLHHILNKTHDFMIHAVIYFMYVAPLGVFCLIARTFATLGVSAVVPLASYLLLIIGMVLFQALVVYPLLLKFFVGLSPFVFYEKIKNVILVGCSTASSNATLPVTLETVQQELGISPSISSFSIPLGATINMDALAVSYGVATVFLSNAYGIELSAWQYITIVFMTIVASIGTAGVPNVGLLALSMVFQQVNLPIEGIPLLMSVSRFSDTIGTALNVTGDIVVTCIVAKSEGEWDITKIPS